MCERLLLNSMGVVPLQALKAAIESYLRHRPELKRLQEDKASLDLAGSTLQSDLETKFANLNTSEARIAELRLMIEQKDLLLRNSATPSQRLRNTIDFCEQEERDMERLTHDTHLAEAELTNLQEVLQIARSLQSPKCSQMPGHSSSSGKRGDDLGVFCCVAYFIPFFRNLSSKEAMRYPIFGFHTDGKFHF